MTGRNRIGAVLGTVMLVLAAMLGFTASATAATTATAATGGQTLAEVRGTVAGVMGADVAAKGKQVAPGVLDFGGFIAKSATSAQLACPYQYLCMEVRGTVFNFYTCGLWTVENWYGTGPWNNNQTKGTVAKFYGQNGKEIWRTGPAPVSGSADWAPVWSLRPC
ncbi:hypothetical protein ACWEPR_38260 [Streptomyces sp. NPDC004290]